MPLAAILLTLVVSLVLLARPGYTHQIVTATGSIPAEAAKADDNRDGGDLLSALTRWVAAGRLGMEERLRVAAVRQQWLAELMEHNPGEVLRQALSPAARAALAPELRGLVEEEESHEGLLEGFHADGPGAGPITTPCARHPGSGSRCASPAAGRTS